MGAKWNVGQNGTFSLLSSSRLNERDWWIELLHTFDVVLASLADFKILTWNNILWIHGSEVSGSLECRFLLHQKKLLSNHCILWLRKSDVIEMSWKDNTIFQFYKSKSTTSYISDKVTNFQFFNNLCFVGHNGTLCNFYLCPWIWI